MSLTWSLAAACLAASSASAATLEGRLVGATKDLQDFVVSLEEGARLPVLPEGGGDAAMNQVRKQFSPRVAAARAGAAVRFENLDDVFHNAFSLDKRNPFDLGLYKGKSRFAEDRRTPAPAQDPAVVFSTAGVYPVFCNIHPDMSGAVYVFDHGYFARADSDGLFSLPVPDAGTVTLIVQSPRLAEPARLTVTLPHPERLSVPVRAKRLALKAPHARKDGSEYGGAYGSRP